MGMWRKRVQTLTSCAIDHCAWPHSQVVVTATARHTQRVTHASQWQASRCTCNRLGKHVMRQMKRVAATVQTLTFCAVDRCAWPHSQVVVTATAWHTHRVTHASVAHLKIRMQWTGHACDYKADACNGNSANTHKLCRRSLRMAMAT